MKKTAISLTIALLVVTTMSAKSLPKIKESNFGSDKYVQKIITSYELTRDSSIPTLRPKDRPYDKVERYVNGDNFVEYAEQEDTKTKTKVNYVGMCIDGVYKSRVWYEITFSDAGEISTSLYEDSKDLDEGGFSGEYELSPDSELYYIFESISFRTLVRRAIQSAYPEWVKNKDDELAEVFIQFYQSNITDTKQYKEAINASTKELKAITQKYKKR